MKKIWQIKAQGTNSVPEVLIYGDIADWYGDVTAQAFSDDLRSLGDINALDVRINSYGGSVFAGQAIYSMLKSHKAKVTVYVDGIAASIASIIAMAGDTVIVPANAMLMIHNPWTYAGGDANEMRKVADDLDKIRETLIAVYMQKSNLSRDEIIGIMDAETWLTGDEAVAKGFADQTGKELAVSASLKDGKAIFNGISVAQEMLTDKGRGIIAGLNKIEPLNGVEPMNLDELKAKHPTLYAQIREEGVKAERDRIAAIEDLGVTGHDALVAEAKFKSCVSAEMLAVQVIKAEKAQKSQYLANAQQDAAGVAGVVETEEPQSSEKEAEKAKNDAGKAKVLDAFNAGVNSRRKG